MSQLHHVLFLYLNRIYKYLLDQEFLNISGPFLTIFGTPGRSCFLGKLPVFFCIGKGATFGMLNFNENRNGFLI